MSRVYLIAADRSLPHCDLEQPQKRVIRLSEHFRNPDLRGQEREISWVSHFSVQPHSYYRSAVEALGYPLKPFQYELTVEQDPWSLEQLLTYLTGQFTPGEQVQLWSLWVGGESLPAMRVGGNLRDFDMETLQQYLTAESICITITI